MGIETAALIGLGLSAAGAGASAYNAKRTADRQDRQLATSIINQGRKQQVADTAVNEEVRKLEDSNAADERAGRLAEYMDIVAKNRGTAEAGLTPGLGSERFQSDAAAATKATQGYAGKMADLMARIDAPSLQRQGEGFAYGKLATDLGLIGREASGQAFLDQLKLNRIQRNPWLDMAAAGLSGAGGGMAAGAGAGSSTIAAGPSGLTYVVPTTRSGAGWHNAYGGG